MKGEPGVLRGGRRGAWQGGPVGPPCRFVGSPCVPHREWGGREDALLM